MGFINPDLFRKPIDHIHVCLRWKPVAGFVPLHLFRFAAQRAFSQSGFFSFIYSREVGDICLIFELLGNSW